MATLASSMEMTTVVRLSELMDGQEADCFAALVRRVRGVTYKNEPFLKCYFRDSRSVIEAPLWANHRLLKHAESWSDGSPYRLHVKAEIKPNTAFRSTSSISAPPPRRRADGFDFRDLYESSQISGPEAPGDDPRLHPQIHRGSVTSANSS